MKRAGLALHAGRDEAVRVGRTLAEQLAARGVEVQTSPSDAARLGSDVVIASESFPEGTELVFVLGGDGTLLRAARDVYEYEIPLLGVNLGRLGFLSELERSEVEDGLVRLLDDGFQVEERMVLEGEATDAGGRTPLWALNEVIVHKVDVGRAIRLAVSIGDEHLTSWSADALICSTPTGSTAYSFSAGGPIVSPRLDCLLLTPSAPHGLFDRTVVVPPDEEVLLRLLPDPDAAALSADGGPSLRLSSGAEVRLRAGARRLRLAKLEPAPFWRLVREKLGLPPDR